MPTPPDAPHSDRPGVAAWDFDGTLVPGDSLVPFLIRLLGRRRFAAAAAGAAPGLAAAVGGRDRNAAKAALLHACLAGEDLTAVRAEGEAFALRLADRVLPERRARLDWHRTQGHRLVLVSASLALYLSPFASSLGFDDLIATELEEDGGRLTGRLLGANVRGEEKARRLRQMLGDVSQVELWAYGDSAGDDAMLALADHPTRVGRRQ